ncbi:metal-dependent hydrolase [Candidatus Falkowbacteria bacterium CG_4_9_14_3_um_filter_36_9]|uniref:Metal-dependent hydrolase n=1 Tax=Candidatus Falkowbacteria bacterium CG02_land_8_20_14_3_00_36_14 TaxID=1974560 RepID=A0A2M7DQA9_9BACT|nr:MAG: metal-dependent hydrolase [Candidatus Falkowbacteria bacterium CG02_land_8_20_14_3_00_36_14]PJA11308.1 MAG: metal-dependent hydrolase [Candidatus Falkowbacteria bacterium CG_4_10_14_0_2_um_filter_36_22]PJB20761.1 MAG: metal-dependent hydrolase [Candidatus Falkowbacteria bacterium CG_4_9_14_3_um_filter_36_9]
MDKKIKIKGEDINYKIRKSRRARRLRLAVYCDTSIIVTMPRGAVENAAEKFLIAKANWLLKKINYFKKYKNTSLSKFSRGDYFKKKKDAFNLIIEKIYYYNKIYNFKFNRISIRNQKTRWGSCSKKGNLNFNYKIIYLSLKLADYIIVHELCHLQEFNHSSQFWNLVARSFPDYKIIKKQLTKEGLLLY